MPKHKSNSRLKTIRASVSFPAADYVELERLAERKRVSVAWVVRDAVSRYLANEAPLFRAVADDAEAKEPE